MMILSLVCVCLCVYVCYEPSRASLNHFGFHRYIHTLLASFSLNLNISFHYYTFMLILFGLSLSLSLSILWHSFSSDVLRIHKKVSFLVVVVVLLLLCALKIACTWTVCIVRFELKPRLTRSTFNLLCNHTIYSVLYRFTAI